ncbi:MAG: radical SAM protein, partial [Mogibacterium sp.]|nr:radical SAM protein [Mogibacterium sp.]
MNTCNINKKNILDFDLAELREVVSEFEEKPFRANQLFDWISKGVVDYSEMRNLPQSLIEKLVDCGYYLGLPEIISSQQSKDGTIKCLFRFDDGAEVESVFMKYNYGNSICISSQVGCRMGCTFCASTMDGLERNLTGGEMLGEVLAMSNHTGENIGHVVVMGMGEPLDNYDELSRFIKLIHNPKGYNLGLRNITVSTCGIIPAMRNFAEDFP